LVTVGLALACSGDRDDILTSGEKLYSQFDEELVIRHFFNDRRGGFFVDVGSYHWRDGSNTYYLEEHLGWSGIAVDALEEFGRGYEENRPLTRFFSYIVTDHSGTTETLYVAGPLSSTVEGHIGQFRELMEDTSHPDHPSQSPDPEVRRTWAWAKAKAERERGSKQRESVERPEIQVPTITLTELLDREGVAKIDLLSMDIEQGEPVALAGFDIDRFQPGLVCIEAHKGVQPALIAYFEKHGYERIEEYAAHDSHNWYFRPKVP
jgi:hypothetical protein